MYKMTDFVALRVIKGDGTFTDGDDNGEGKVSV
jgi:hypothetical protein